MRRLYDWVLSWADSRFGGLALGVIAFAESSFFPVPPDLLLIALAMGKPRRSWWFAAICSVGSVLGGIAGYFIGWKLYDLIGVKVIEFYGLADKYDHVAHLYQEYSGWAVAAAGFTPLPYKVFTIAAGAFHVPFAIFVVASALSRSARFFLVAGLIWKFGPSIKPFIDRYFNLLAILAMVLLIGGFVVLRLVL